MKRVNALFPFIMIILFMTSCTCVGNNNAIASKENEKPNSNSTAVPGKGILENKEEWHVVEGVNTGYVKLDDIKPKNVEEIKVGFRIDNYNDSVAVSDDEILCGSTEELDDTSSKNNILMPKIRKLDKTGRIIWEKSYDYKICSGRLNHLLFCNGGDFIFSVQTNSFYDGNNLINQSSFIVKCSANGDELWKRDFADSSGEILHEIFIDENNEIIVIGQSQDQNGTIVVTKLDANGKIAGSKGFGGSDVDNLNTAQYDDRIGIVINGRSQCTNGDFATAEGRSSGNFIVCIDKKLRIKWLIKANAGEEFEYNLLTAENGSVFAAGRDAINGSNRFTCFVMKVDKNGERVWKKSQLAEGLWPNAMAVFNNGDVILGAGQFNKGILVILDKDGNEKKKFEKLNYSAGRITPLSDGGFIVTAYREIKTVPQPPVISSIWYDTELVMIKYNNDFSLNWRKTYDKYKDKIGQDFAYPLKDGKVIISEL